MKREIKFRVFSTVFSEDKMYYDVEMQIKEDGVWWMFGERTRIFQVSSEQCSLMQFTGLKDKNGKEIWEGDIIDHANGLGVVIFKDGRFYYEPTPKLASQYIVGALYWDTVIGNIYENPELLTN